ncbi:MAG: choline-sulfatase [Pseudomonadota bacterium]
MQDGTDIIFVQTDQLTPSVLRAYGDPVCHAPQIEALAGEGVVFEEAYCNFPLCAPSRMSMATGRLASRVGAYDNGADLPASTPTYAHFLRALGYRTCLSGKMHFVGPDQLHGFEERLTPDIYPSDFLWSADWEAKGHADATDARMLDVSGPCARTVQMDYDELVTARAVRRIYDAAREADERPLFMHVSYTHPHDPYLCTQDHWDLYRPNSNNGLDGLAVPMPAVMDIAAEDRDPHSLALLRQHGLLDHAVDPEKVQRARRAYYGAVSFIDDQIGQIRAALRATGREDRTILVFSSDHGDMLGERGMWLKKTFFENALRIPLIVHAPARFAPSRVPDPVSLIDLLPTLVDFAGGSIDALAVEPLDGKSLAPACRGEAVEGRDVVAELLSEGTPAPAFMIRRGRFKYTHCAAFPDQLYDLTADPTEMHNLADNPAHADRVETFRRDVATRWDVERLEADIRLSQRRRKFVADAMAKGRRTSWDYVPAENDSAWFRGQCGYNDWAFDRVPLPGKDHA